MRIAYILHSFPRLHNTFILNEMIALMDKGHDLFVISMNNTREKVRNKDVERVQGRVRYAGDFLAGHENRLAQKFVNLLNAVLRRFRPVHVVVGRVLFGRGSSGAQIERYLGYFGWKVYSFAPIAEFLKREGVEFIHAGFGNRPATAAMALSDLTGIPFSFATHAYDLFVDFPFAEQKIAKASWIFTISHYNRRYLSETHGCPASKVVVMRVPFNKAHCEKLVGTPKEDGLVVTVCRLHPIKGLNYAIEAFSKVAGNQRHARFVIVGNGPLRDSLEDQVRRLSLENRVTFLGDIPNEAALQYIARASVFLLPSVVAENGDRDGIPTSLIEAMYLGTPVVSTKVSGIPELVDDGINGYLAEPGDADQLATRLDQLLGSTTLRAEIAAKGREKVERGFYSKDSAELLMDAWGEMLGSGARQRMRDVVQR